MRRIVILGCVFTVIFPFLSLAQENQISFDNILLIINYNHPYYESIPLIRKIYTPYFPNIVFYGPKKHPDVHLCEHFNGWYSYLAIVDAMKRYPDFEGYFFVHDDCIIQPWNLKRFNQSKIWTFGSGVLDLNKGLGATGAGVWWKKPCGYVATKKAFDLLPQKFKKTLEENSGVAKVHKGYSDILYVPAQYKNDFIELVSIFGDQKVFLEIALPTIVSCLTLKENCEHLFGQIVWDQIISPTNFSLDVYCNHPFKLSKAENREFIKNLFDKMLHKDKSSM